MKTIIQIEIEYPDGDKLYPSKTDLEELKTQAIDIFGVWEDIKDKRWKFSIKEQHL